MLYSRTNTFATIDFGVSYFKSVLNIDNILTYNIILIYLPIGCSSQYSIGHKYYYL